MAHRTVPAVDRVSAKVNNAAPRPWLDTGCGATGLEYRPSTQPRAWLTAHPRVTAHFTPTHASWMNLVEVWFSIIERQAIHRGSFTSVHDLNAKIRVFITGWNDHPRPFTWTKTPEQILSKANRKKTSDAGH